LKKNYVYCLVQILVNSVSSKNIFLSNFWGTRSGQ
jgi:hypothetical protein